MAVEQAPSEEKIFPLWRWLSLAGALLCAAVIFLVPLFVPPPSIFRFQLDTNLTILSKWLLLQWLSVGALCVGAICLLTPLARRYASPAALPTTLLLGWLLWSGVSLLINPNSAHAASLWFPILCAGLAACCGPMFFSSQRRHGLLLGAALAASVIVCTIGIASTFGVPHFIRFLYGIEISALREARWFAEGGARSATAMSTLANPEYAGTYTAAMLCLWAVVLLDWCSWLAGRARAENVWMARIACLIAIGLCFLQIVFTGSRQAFITVAIAGFFRLCVEIAVPRRWLAAGFATYLIMLVWGGVLAGIVTLLAGIAAVFVLSRGAIIALIRRTNIFNSLLVVVLPVTLVTLALLYSIPGPWNPSGLRVLGRFSSLLSSNDNSYVERLVMFSLASEMARENPLFGVGPGRYRSEFKATFADLMEADRSGVFALMSDRFGNRIGEQAHNDYLHIAAETGLVGLSLFLLMVFTLLAALSRAADQCTGSRRLLAISYLVVIAAFLLLMLSSFPLHMPSRAAVWWMLIGGALGFVAMNQATDQKPAL